MAKISVIPQNTRVLETKNNFLPNPETEEHCVRSQSNHGVLSLVVVSQEGIIGLHPKRNEDPL